MFSDLSGGHASAEVEKHDYKFEEFPAEEGLFAFVLANSFFLGRFKGLINFENLAGPPFSVESGYSLVW